MQPCTNLRFQAGARKFGSSEVCLCHPQQIIYMPSDIKGNVQRITRTASMNSGPSNDPLRVRVVSSLQETSSEGNNRGGSVISSLYFV